jgi:hypothetical protein
VLETFVTFMFHSYQSFEVHEKEKIKQTEFEEIGITSHTSRNQHKYQRNSGKSLKVGRASTWYEETPVKKWLKINEGIQKNEYFSKNLQPRFD